MKLKRVIQLKKKDESLTIIDDEVEHDNFVYYVDRIEKRAQEVYGYHEGKIKVPKITPEKEKKAAAKLIDDIQERREGTAFDSIPLDAEDFNLFNVEITRIGEIQTGTGAKTGNDWFMQSITVKDTKGKTRDLIAWGDHIELFGSLKVGDMLDIHNISKIKEYKGKHQYTLGKSSEIVGAEMGAE